MNMTHEREGGDGGQWLPGQPKLSLCLLLVGLHHCRLECMINADVHASCAAWLKDSGALTVVGDAGPRTSRKWPGSAG